MTYDATGSAGAGTSVGDQSTTEQAKQRAAEVKGQAQEKVRDVVEGQVDERSDQAADKIESVAGDVRAVSDSLQDRGQDAAARVVEQGADYAQQFSDYLRGSNSDQILNDVAAFARRQPWAVAAGGLLLGFAASRVLRASADSTTSSGGSGSSTSGNGSTGTYAMPSPGQLPLSTPTVAPDLRDDPYASAADPLATSSGRLGPGASSVDGR